MQRNWEANGNPRINLCSSPPPPLAGPCPPSPRYSPPVMPELLLANNNAPTPAIPEHFKGEVDKGAGSGWGREGKYRPPPTSCRCRPGRAAQCGRSGQPSAPSSRGQPPCCAFSFSLLLSPCPFPCLLLLPAIVAGLRAQGGEPGRYPAVPELPAAPRQPPRRGCGGGGWRRGSGGCPRLPIAARLRRRPEPRRCGRGGMEGGREGGRQGRSPAETALGAS